MSASQFPPLQSTPSTKRCSNCSTLMSIYRLPGHYGQQVEIDVCHDCNALWFDQMESSKLSPDGTVALFQLINERGGASSTAASKFGQGLRCVTCGDGMRLTNDRVKNTRFSYQACSRGHGRLTTFYNFLAEKQFVRELTQAERAKLAASVQQIKCSSCAAPVNIGKTDACEYCRAPVSVFDRDAAKKAIDHYLQERQKQVPGNAPIYGGPAGGYRASGWNGYDTAELASDILFALSRAAVRGLGSAGARAVPAAAGVGAGSVLADTGAAASGGLLESIGSGVSGGASALPSATDALFGSGLGDGLAASLGSGLSSGLGSSLASDVGGGALGRAGDMLANAGGALPSATEALFGSVSSGAGDVAGSLMGEIGNVFTGSAASGLTDAASSMVTELGGGALEAAGGGVMDAVGGSALDLAGDVASSAGEGVIDLVADGLGSLLGALFD
jgi:Transcription factor zinc-finger